MNLCEIKIFIHNKSHLLFAQFIIIYRYRNFVVLFLCFSFLAKLMMNVLLLLRLRHFTINLNYCSFPIGDREYMNT